MANMDPKGTLTFKELMVSSLIAADALAKLLIEKGIITEAEFTAKLSGEQDVYQALLKTMS